MHTSLIFMQPKLNRKAKPGSYLLKDLVQGIKAPAKVKVHLTKMSGFMFVNNSGILHISWKYWRTADPIDIYLDLIHELVHVKQAHKGIDLFNPKYSYVNRPTEIEAYKAAIAEARRLKLPEEKIFNHIDVPWIKKEEKERLKKNLNFK